MQTKDSARAVCPWYEWSTEKLIVCAGTEPGQTIRMQFRGRKKKEQWFERCCAGYDYGKCVVCRALTAHSEETSPRGETCAAFRHTPAGRNCRRPAVTMDKEGR